MEGGVEKLYISNAFSLSMLPAWVWPENPDGVPAPWKQKKQPRFVLSAEKPGRPDPSGAEGPKSFPPSGRAAAFLVSIATQAKSLSPWKQKKRQDSFLVLKNQAGHIPGRNGKARLFGAKETGAGNCLGHPIQRAFRPARCRTKSDENRPEAMATRRIIHHVS
jgi:hypothetical protein